MRKVHIISSKYAEKGSAGFISQRDMALTQFGFLGYATFCPDSLGIQVSCENLEAFVHFWRVIGHMVGLEERFNLCTESLDTTRLRLKLIVDQVYRPYLENTTDDFYQMCDALISGLWCFNPLLDTKAFIYYTRWLSGCKNHVYYPSELRALENDPVECQKIIQSFGFYTRWILYLVMTAHTYLINFATFRSYFNFQLWLAEYIIYFFPFLAIFKFGTKKAYVRILKGEKFA